MTDSFSRFCSRADGGLALPALTLEDQGLQDIWSAATENIKAAYAVSRLPADIALVAEWLRWLESEKMTKLIVGKTRVVQRQLAEEQLDDFVRAEMQQAWHDQRPEEGEPYVGHNGSGRVLDAALQSFGLDGAASSLRRQTLVLSWSAVEVGARDVFARLLNARPRFVLQLRNSELAAKRFQLKRLDLDLFIEHGFDLTGKLGDMLLRQADVDSVAALRDVFHALLPNATSLFRLLDGQELYLLSKRRHLIVHKASVVSADYLAETGDEQSAGELLNITVGEVNGAIRLAVDSLHQLTVAADAAMAAAV